MSHLGVKKKKKEDKKSEKSKREAGTFGKQIDYIANKALRVFIRDGLWAADDLQGALDQSKIAMLRNGKVKKKKGKK